MQIDDYTTGKFSCELRETGGINPVFLQSPSGIADGTWHRVKNYTIL